LALLSFALGMLCELYECALLLTDPLCSSRMLVNGFAPGWMLLNGCSWMLSASHECSLLCNHGRGLGKRKGGTRRAQHMHTELVGHEWAALVSAHTSAHIRHK